MQLGALPIRRRMADVAARALLLAASLLVVAVLVWLLVRVGQRGLPHLDWQFLTSMPSILRPERAGIKPALIGSLWLAGLTMAMALPVGVLAGIHLNEYSRPTRLNSLIRLAIANLAGVPSIVFGILGLAVFVRLFGLGYVILAGALTLAVLSLPIIIVSTEEALKAVPKAIREAAYGLGATKWQVTKDHVLPYAIPGILTGSILALSRAAGETAPLILVGGAAAAFSVPDGPLDSYTALPLLSYVWATESKPALQVLATTTTVVLLGFILLANMAAILLRNRFQKRLRW